MALPPLIRLNAVRPLAVGVLLAVCSLSSHALYKVVGPDGKVTYTDRAPSDLPAQTLKANGAVGDTSALPFELRQVASRYPVTLYTGANCPPCDRGRMLLQQRGVPFTEKTVNTADDLAALQRREGTNQLPVLRIGQQQVAGFAEREWTSYLDAAGYPKQSALPRSYRTPPASALAPAESAPSVASTPSRARRDAAPATDSDAATPSRPPAGNAPPGFRF